MEGQIVSAIAEAVFDVSPPFFLTKCILYIYPLARKKKAPVQNFNSSPRNMLLLLGGIAAVLGLRCSCQPKSPKTECIQRIFLEP